MNITIFNLIEALWFILPAYAANGLAVLARGKHPIDFNKKFIDKKPLLGRGKTYEGFIFAVFISTCIATVEMLVLPYLPFDESPVELYIVKMTPFIGFVLGVGAMLGDMMGSFIKRRIGIERGRPAPVLDQDDFIIGSILASSFFISIKIEWIILLLIITPFFHLLANVIAYLLRLKNEPY